MRSVRAPLRLLRASRFVWVVPCALALAGCNAFQPATYVPPDVAYGPPPVAQPNPIQVPVMDRDFVWNQVVDVVDDYFRIQKEERIRQVGDLLTEGRLDTYPRGGSTIFEPWNKDSVTPYEKVYCTFQSVRRTALVRVIPAQGGYLVDVQVYKYLEDLPRPETGAVTFANSAELRNDNSLKRVTSPIGGQQPTLGWIEQGRDVALEQTILAHIQQRMSGFGAPVVF